MARIHCRQYVGTKKSQRRCVLHARAHIKVMSGHCLSLVARRVACGCSRWQLVIRLLFVISSMCFSMVFDLSYVSPISTMLTLLRTVYNDISGSFADVFSPYLLGIK